MSPTPRPRIDLLALEELVDRALSEDVRTGDVTSRALIPPDSAGRATLLLKECATCCGLEVAELTFRRLDEAVRFETLVREGQEAAPGAVLARIEGNLRAMLAAERTALNLLQRACGIATATRACVDAVAGTGVLVLDTRKTAPGLRALDRMAVRAGGGHNHRMALDDMILVKDNHVTAVGSLTRAVALALQAGGHARKVEVEVASLSQLDELLALPRLPDAVLLDNFTPEQVREAVRRAGGRLFLEVSGGVTAATIRAHAEAGPGGISLGSLTHSVRAVDISLEVDAT
jgi:nicotinate-nucleotide pyrophosphorylase (carboxylating)